MEDDTLFEFAKANLPSQICPLSQQPIKDPAIMHRDLSDNWPSTLHDMRDNRLANVMIVDKLARDRYYAKLQKMAITIGFSGGLDSTTLLHWAASLFGQVNALTFDYGQRHKVEIHIAEDYIKAHEPALSEIYGTKIVHRVVKMDVINQLAPSSLTREDSKPPENQATSDMTAKIPNTFVPGRNIYFITALAQVAYTSGSRHIGMGVNVLDYSGYPDCRPEFLVKMREALAIGVFNGMDIGMHAPLMYLNKVNIIRLGESMGVKYGLTHSCYNGVLGGCSVCDSCILRREAFKSLGKEDPAIAHWRKK
jgi:7-cyano-7-deazaguanine synthase